MVASRNRICDQPLHWRAVGYCGAEGRHPSPAAAEGLHPNHSDRGAQYACEVYRRLLADKAGRLDGPAGNPYDNAKAESFIRTILMDYETFEDVTADLPRFIDQVIRGPNSTR